MSCDIIPTRYWGKKPMYVAKVGTGPTTIILIKRARKFSVGQRIEFCLEDDVRGMSVGTTPHWRHGRIWDVKGGYLFIEY